MILGIDCSTYLEELSHGAKYYDESGNPVDPVEILRNNGVSVVRLRLWVDPHSEDGTPYLAGTCDLDCFIRTAKLFLAHDYRIMLDIHYSDFWADPGKQFIPKSWHIETIEDAENKVYEYTSDVLRRIAAEHIPLDYIQVGNEITNGILWPIGKLVENPSDPNGARLGYDRLTRLLKAGVKACRELTPSSKLILHLERSYDIAMYNEFFDNMRAYNVDYDVIGMSYYPYWHGNLDQYFGNVDNLKSRYGKEVFTAELGYAFTLEDYIKEDGVGGARLVIGESNAEEFGFFSEYPVSREGQAKFTHDFLAGAVDHDLDGVFWWEPLWIPGDGICWASQEAKVYIGETHKTSCRNEWANQCLFDYQGKILPALKEYQQKT